MMASSQYFQNADCEYFPCHPNIDPENFSCLFCYCPLYHLKDCGGNPQYLVSGLKDCSSCTLPHRDYQAIIDKLMNRHPQINGLKPCPFCGSEDVEFHHCDYGDGDIINDVICGNCGATVDFSQDEASTKASWNRR